MKIARNSPYYKRNRAHICSFWVKGECKRGEECPYRHEKPTDPDDPLSDQNLKDRYFGSNDPVAAKLMKKINEIPKPIPPDDKTITTLYIGNVGDRIIEQDLKDYFYQFGEIRSISIVRKQNCAFITFTSRKDCEAAIEKSFQKLLIQEQKLAVRWGKPIAKRQRGEADDDEDRPTKLPTLPGTSKCPEIPGLNYNRSRA